MLAFVAPRKRQKPPEPTGWLAEVDANRLARGWSKRELARRAGVQAPSITRLYRGDASYDTAVKVAKALDMPPPHVAAAELFMKFSALPPDERAAAMLMIDRLLAASREKKPPNPPSGTQPG